MHAPVSGKVVLFSVPLFKGEGSKSSDESSPIIFDFRENEELIRKELEESEMEGDEKLSELEVSLAEATKQSDEALNLLNEAKRRCLVVQNDLKVAKDREDEFTSKAMELAETLKNLNDRTRFLEEADDEASEREQTTEEKKKFLEDQIKELLLRADEAERQYATLQRVSEGLILEINSLEEKKKEVVDEMDTITDLADDI